MLAGARVVLRVSNRNYQAFAEKGDRERLEQLRNEDERLKHARITEVLQLHPSSVQELTVYPRF